MFYSKSFTQAYSDKPHRTSKKWRPLLTLLQPHINTVKQEQAHPHTHAKVCATSKGPTSKYGLHLRITQFRSDAKQKEKGTECPLLFQLTPDTSSVLLSEPSPGVQDGSKLLIIPRPCYRDVQKICKGAHSVDKMYSLTCHRVEEMS